MLRWRTHQVHLGVAELWHSSLQRSTSRQPSSLQSQVPVLPYSTVGWRSWPSLSQCAWISKRWQSPLDLHGWSDERAGLEPWRMFMWIHQCKVWSGDVITTETKTFPVVRLQLLPCSSLAGPAAQKNLKQSDCSCCPAALLLGLPPQKSQVRRVQLLSCSFLTGPATKKS